MAEPGSSITRRPGAACMDGWSWGLDLRSNRSIGSAVMSGSRGGQWPRNAWIEAIWTSNLRPLERLVAMAYADHARGGLTAFVAPDRLVQRTGMSRRATVAARRALIEAGWLTEVEPAAQHRTTVFKTHDPQPCTRCRSATSQPCTKRRAGFPRHERHAFSRAQINTEPCTRCTPLKGTPKCTPQHRGGRSDRTTRSSSRAVQRDPSRARARSAPRSHRTRRTRGTTIVHAARFFAKWPKDAEPRSNSPVNNSRRAQIATTRGGSMTPRAMPSRNAPTRADRPTDRRYTKRCRHDSPTRLQASPSTTSSICHSNREPATCTDGSR